LRSPERGTFKPEVETLEQRALLNSGWAFDPFYSPSMATTPVATGDPSTSVFAQSQSGGLTMGTDSSSILGDPYFAQSPFSNFDPSGWLSNNYLPPYTPYMQPDYSGADMPIDFSWQMNGNALGYGFSYGSNGLTFSAPLSGNTGFDTMGNLGASYNIPLTGWGGVQASGSIGPDGMTGCVGPYVGNDWMYLSLQGCGTVPLPGTSNIAISPPSYSGYSDPSIGQYGSDYGQYFGVADPGFSYGYGGNSLYGGYDSGGYSYGYGGNSLYGTDMGMSNYGQSDMYSNRNPYGYNMGGYDYGSYGSYGNDLSTGNYDPYSYSNSYDSGYNSYDTANPYQYMDNYGQDYGTGSWDAYGGSDSGWNYDPSYYNYQF
jgi:hypothetical protein